MKNFFCQPCSEKAKWAFDFEKAFQHCCQRCFAMKPCNDYNYKLMQRGVHQTPAAPAAHQIVHTHVNTQAQVNLPRAAAAMPQEPVPVVVVGHFIQERADAVVTELPSEVIEKEVEGVPAPLVADAAVVESLLKASDELPKQKFTQDDLLNALQPNRPGIKMVTKSKATGNVPEAGATQQNIIARNAEAKLPQAGTPIPMPKAT